MTTTTEKGSRQSARGQDKDKPPYTRLKFTLLTSSLVASLVGTRMLARAAESASQTTSLYLDEPPTLKSQTLATVRRYVMVVPGSAVAQAATETSPVPTTLPGAGGILLPNVPPAEEQTAADAIPELDLLPVATAIPFTVPTGDEVVPANTGSSAGSGSTFDSLPPIPTAVPYVAPPSGGGGGGGGGGKGGKGGKGGGKSKSS